jgi:hypothetical protein
MVLVSLSWVSASLYSHVLLDTGACYLVDALLECLSCAMCIYGVWI